MRIALTALIFAACVHAESSTSLAVPGGELVAMGEPGVIRPIVGIRGSRVIGSPVPQTVSGIVAPGGGFAMVEDARGWSLIRTGATDAAKTYLRPTADQVTFSTTGSAVAFLDKASATVEVWTGLPSAPLRRASLSASAAAGILGRIEISDDGAVCLGISDSGDVYELSAENAPRRTALARPVGAVRFAPRGRDVMLLGADGQLLFGNHVTGEIRPVTGLVDVQFDRLVLSSDADAALAVNSTSLVVVPLDGNDARTVPWARTISRVSALRDGQFAITVAGESGAWILSRDATLSYVAEF